MGKPKDILLHVIEMQAMASMMSKKATLVRAMAEERVSTPSKKPVIDPDVVAARLAKRRQFIAKKTKR